MIAHWLLTKEQVSDTGKVSWMKGGYCYSSTGHFINGTNFNRLQINYSTHHQKLVDV
jgi:hypothetical protein